MDYHKSFLISCVGAYDDSGIGTGGLVCLYEGRPVVIDKMDCTGLYQHNATIYRFVRSMQSIIGYNKQGIKFFLKLPETEDVHDILVMDNNFICVSTGKNQIDWFDPFGNRIRSWKAKGEGDSWHLNCLCHRNGKLYVSAFGKFETHREWNGKCSNTGFLLDIGTNKKVLSGLSGPHNPNYIDEYGWAICESHKKAVTIQTESGKIRQLTLNGFTRGLAYDSKYLYVGESADRKGATLQNFSFVSIIDRVTFQVVDRLKIPFPEIYEILLISSEFAKTMALQKERFIFDFTSGRIEVLEKQVERGMAEVEKLRQQINEPIIKQSVKRISRFLLSH